MSNLNQDADNDPDASQYVALHASPTIDKCREFSLVLEATGFANYLTQSGNNFYLLVKREHAEAAYQQLKLYVAENQETEVIAKPMRPFSEGYIGAYIYAFVLILVAALDFSSSNNSVLGNDLARSWQSLGVAHSEKIMSGEWWRTITALTLHANLGHLAGNVGLGALFGLMVSQYIGRGAAWLSILIAGAMGNALNAYFYQVLHLSIGASTMVFAALGILGIFAISDRHSYMQNGLRRWSPLFATIALLGFLGTGGERTDLMAHLLGYASGLMVGTAWVQLLKRNEEVLVFQKIYGQAALLLVFIAWVLAISS